MTPVGRQQPHQVPSTSQQLTATFFNTISSGRQDNIGMKIGITRLMPNKI
jgi:hypothetical protein